MRKFVVYFHGYGSKANGDKVQRLRAAMPDTETYSFDYDLDPRVSLKALGDLVDSALLGDLYHEPFKMVLVGTSLGAWYASYFANKYKCKAILINPCYDPQNMLKKYDLPQDVLDAYSPMDWNVDADYFISVYDEVIDFSSCLHGVLANGRTNFFYETDHKFNGEEFNDVITAVKRHLNA
jgi:predicted esterase YcpF (UPF0227 family)